MVFDDRYDDIGDKDNAEKGRYIYYPERFERYVINTRFLEPHNEIIELAKQLAPGYAIEFGTGAGNDAVYLLKNGWNVTGIDLNKPAEQEILNRINPDEEKRFRFINSSFEGIRNKGIPKNYYDLAYSFDSLSFCNKDRFFYMWEEIVGSLKSGGKLVCNLFGIHDDFNIKRVKMIFFSRDMVIKMLKKDFLFDENNPNEFREIHARTPKANENIKNEHSFIILATKK